MNKIDKDLITEINTRTNEENHQFIYSDDEETISINDVWKRPLSSTDEIRMILSRLINELYICDKIIEYKNIIEEKVNRDYHYGYGNGSQELILRESINHQKIQNTMSIMF